jgi:4-diphosphocytidyl-2-C-methyl-D-erythritol kinase
MAERPAAAGAAGPGGAGALAATVAVAAPAKLNLYLHVTGRRPDGYHLLDSLVAFAGVRDTVAAAPADALSLAVEGPFAAAVPAGGDNLALRAAGALARLCGETRGARLTLAKRLPVGAGMGGGSADAAAAIRALTALWGARPPADEVQRLALALGADVPACLAGRAAFVGGIGERIAAAPALPPCWVVLAHPGRPLATEAVYRGFGGRFSGPARFDEAPADARSLARLLDARGNDLTEAAVRLEPAVGDVLAALASLPKALLARMTGSGAACFALFAGVAEAGPAAAILKAKRPAWWVAAAPLLGDAGRLEP